MKKAILLMCGVLVILGCARVKVEGSKEPIKLDISMRLDIYQHVQKDIDDIEGIVNGTKTEGKTPDKQSFLGRFETMAYAEEEMDPEIKQAALNRKARLPQVSILLETGVVGENKSALLEIKDTVAADVAVQTLVAKENADRQSIYQAIAKKRGTDVGEVQKLYAQKLQMRAPAGSWIEAQNSSGSYEWKKK